MPMDESRYVERVVNANPELFSNFRDEARRAIRLANAEDRRRFSVHFNAAPLDAQDRGWLAFYCSGRLSRLCPRAKRRGC